MDITVEEGIKELSCITTIDVKIKDISFQQIPEPRNLAKELLELAKVSLPTVIPSRTAKVATRKKLPSRRKPL